MKRTAVVLLALPVTLAAQESDPFRLDRIVVTATARPMPLASVPAAVTVLEGAELRARGIRTVADALRYVPGAMVASSGPQGSLTALFLRGGEANYVQVLVDGVQVNEPGGSFDFADLTLDDVERIEIVRGPTSVLYGSDAVAGVVHIVTRGAAAAAHADIAIDAGLGERVGAEADGSYAMTGVAATLGGTRGAVSYDLDASHRTNAGVYAFNNGYENLTVSGGGSIAYEGGAARANARIVDATYEFPTNGAGALIDRDQRTDRRAVLLGVEASRRLSSVLDLRLALTTQRYRFHTVDRPDDAGDTIGIFASSNRSVSTRSAVDARLDAALADGWTLSVGAEAERQAGETRYVSRSDFGPYADSTENDRSNVAAYGQLQGDLSRFSFTAGARADRNDRFGTFGSWRAGATVRMAADTRVRGAAGAGFKEPTLYENYATGFVRGNPALDPELSRSWEIGLEQVLLGGRARLGATWFDQHFEDLIVYVGAPPDPGSPNYVNIGQATSSGLEATAALVLEAIVVDASYTHLMTEVLDEGDGQDRSFLAGRPLLRRPSDQWSVSASWQAAGKARLMLSALHVGRRDDLDFADPAEWQGLRVVLPSHTTFDASTELSLGSGLVLTGAVRNVTGERYHEIANFPAPGRTVMLGLRASF